MCPVCHGKGGVPPHLHTCPLCVREATHASKWASIDDEAVGPGMLTWKSKLSANVTQARTQTCHVCHGFGQVVEKGHECGRCMGDRMVVENVPISFWVPIGATESYTVRRYAGTHHMVVSHLCHTCAGVLWVSQKRFRGEGSSSLSSPHAADLVFRVKIPELGGFRRSGGELYTSVNISLEVRAVTAVPLLIQGSPPLAAWFSGSC